MPTNGLRRALDRLRQALTPHELTDEHLLKQFIAVRDESAFATLVRRHGAMVLGVSRRVLGNWHDSEDVFQATFLVLAQKARCVVARQALASWLYMVAYRTALKAKARNDRRRQKERQVQVMPHPEVAPTEAHDWQPVLDRELSRLPEKFRLPIILCDLEGRTRKEVECQLGLREGTLSSRLTTGRKLLAKRLTRRGVTLSGGALATALSETGACAHVSPALVEVAAKGAVLLATGNFAAVSASVAFLMKGALKAMFMAKLKAFAMVAFVALLGAGTLVYTAGGQPAGQARQPSELEILRKENELLRVNLRVTLEKIQALETELAGFKGKKTSKTITVNEFERASKTINVDDLGRAKPAVETVDKKVLNFFSRELHDPTAKNTDARFQRRSDKPIPSADKVSGGSDPQDALRRAAEALEQAARVLRQQGAASEGKPK